MALVQLESLVLPGVRIAGDVVTGLERNGSMQAEGGNPTMAQSQERHPGYRPADTDPVRAGRPGCPGVPCRRGPAITAGRAILSGWSPSGSQLHALLLATPRASVKAMSGAMLPGRPSAFTRGPLQADRRLAPAAWQRSGKRGGRAPQASTRGK
jgi:hypothetical protein